ncbi:protein PIN-LIKES 7-like [Durio zibethinus]|uniref:Protein PIN-LIKES 7-like n=1 Tax=Durio zibethinus TaxID=66656 RepID=A0A6P5YH77_DURZI|nr:protein PIN-LIKES 7-like [Durio zibethinus]XP_022739421.1 protein PIN-LIKES 7-like [Durio zibethinus]XP_022739422.1 protein PIN-LIKES 7-like [Durio zibethinus]
MGFWALFEVASMPILQIFIISLLGAFMATDYCKLLPEDTRRSLNKLVFVVFTPALMFASLAKTVTLQDIISWWFMPVNIGITFLVGGIVGWIVVKILRPKPHLEGLIIATCSSGNLGNLLLIIVPAICNEDGSPFGNRNVCNSVGLSYASFSMALGGFYIWTISYQMLKISAVKFKAFEAAEAFVSKEANKSLDATAESQLLKGESEEQVAITLATKSIEDPENQANVSQESSPKQKGKASFWVKAVGFLRQILEELMAPPTLGAILGFLFGATGWLRNLIIGEGAPLRVIQDSIKLLGDATIPCITLILGANLIQGLRSSTIRPLLVVGVVGVRYIILPAIGILVVKAAGNLGFLPSDPLFRYVLMIQFTLPPAMNIGTMTQLFNVGQEECSVLFLWSYLAAALALTTWPTVFMWILT